MQAVKLSACAGSSPNWKRHLDGLAFGVGEESHVGWYRELVLREAHLAASPSWFLIDKRVKGGPLFLRPN